MGMNKFFLHIYIFIERMYNNEKNKFETKHVFLTHLQVQ